MFLCCRRFEARSANKVDGFQLENVSCSDVDDVLSSTLPLIPPQTLMSFNRPCHPRSLCQVLSGAHAPAPPPLVPHTGCFDELKPHCVPFYYFAESFRDPEPSSGRCYYCHLVHPSIWILFERSCCRTWISKYREIFKI